MRLFKHISNNYLSEFIFSILSFVVAFVYAADFNIVYDDYGSFSYCNLPGGQFSDFSSVDYFYNGLIGISYGYKLLYGLIPSVNWTGITFLLFTFLSLFILLVVIKKSLLVPQWLLMLLQLTISIAYIENFTILSHTRFSLAFCGAGVLGLAFVTNLSSKEKLFYFLLFVFGTLVRPESAFGMLLVVGAGAIIYKVDFFLWLQKLWMPVSFTALLASIMFLHWTVTDEYLIKVEPEIEYKAMAKHLVPLSEMKTATDSAKQVALGRGIWFDMKTMNPEYMRSILLPSVKHESQHTVVICKHVAELYESYFLLPMFTLMIAFGGLFFQNTRSAAMKSLLFQFIFFAIIFLLDYNRKMVAGRHFLNLLMVASVIALLYFRRVSLSKLANVFLLIILVLLGYGSYATISSCKINTSFMYSNIHCSKGAMEAFEKMFSGRTVVINVNSFPLLDHEFSIANKLYTKNRYILFDAFTYSLTPRYQDYLNRICQCNNQQPVDFFKWLIKENALYISRAERTDATARFMKAVHNYPINFNEVLPMDTFPCMASFGTFQNMYVFTISESQ